MEASETEFTATASQGSHLRPAKGKSLPTVVQLIREHSSKSLEAQLDNYLSSAEELFFQLADRARSNSDQTLCFEARREIQRKKNSVIARFKFAYEDGFSILTARPNNAPKQAEPSVDELNLIETGEMETSVAISRMVTRSRQDCRSELYQLQQRFQHLFRDYQINPDNNPLDPQQIANVLKQACNILDLETQGKVILFRHFERCVATHFPALYQAANQQLIDAGVLPKVSHAVRKSPTQKGDIGPVTGQGEQGKESAQRGSQPPAEFSREFSELSQLLSNVREYAVRGNLGFPLFISQGNGPALEPQELTSLLSEIQKSNPLERSGAQLLQPQLDLRTLLEQTLAERRNRGEKNKVQRSDEDVINLIAMFFDFVLDDKQLPIQVQALVSRLQIPVLKVALRDRKFFSSSSHPARRLINEIVAAGVGLDDREAESRTALVKKISDVVHDIHDNYEEGNAVFLTGLEILRAFRKREEQRSRKIEKRTSEAAEAEARTRHTKAMIEDLVLERLENIEAPKIVQEFAIHEWQQVLLLAFLKHGKGSAEWVEAMQCLDDLIWTSLKHDDEKSLRRLQRILPDLQQRQLKLLATAKPSEDAARNALHEIVAFQDLLRTTEPVAVDRETLAEEQKQVLQSTPRPEKSWKEMTAVERQQVQYQALTYDFIRKADEIPVGTWVIFSKSPDGGDSIRCKLAAKIETSDSYIFVNRMGFKLAEKKRKEFAYNLQQGRARVIEHERFFDRMMNKVTTRLHSQIEQEQAAPPLPAT